MQPKNSPSPVAAAAAGAFLSLTVPAPGNILTNPGFEEELAGWSQQGGSQEPFRALWARLSGDWGFWGMGWNSNRNSWIFQEFPAVPGQIFTFSGFFKLERNFVHSGRAFIELVWVDDNGAELKRDTVAVGGAQGFTEHTVVGDAPDGVASVRAQARWTTGVQVPNCQQCSVLLDDFSLTTTAPPAELAITEFVAENRSGLEDEEVQTSDWIEIQVPQGVDIGEGYSLTNDPGDLTRWRIPSGATPNSARFLVVRASGLDRSDPAQLLHANFTLEKDGGFVALVAPDGKTVVSQFNYGEQVEDVAFGTLGDSEGFLETPTPGFQNSGRVAPAGRAGRIAFSHSSRVLTEALAQPLTITGADPLPAGAEIRFTLDGTVPAEDSPVYPGGGVGISDTTVVRARIFEPGKLPGPVRSRTFVRLAADLVDFSSNLPLLVAVSQDGFDIDQDHSPNNPRPFHPFHVFIIAPGPDGRARMVGAIALSNRAGMHVRGGSTSSNPKKSYSLEFWDNSDDDKKVAPPGFEEESDFVLYGPWSDKSLLRNLLVYGVARAEHGHLGGMMARPVELFIDIDGGGPLSMADYRGLYVLVEKIKRGRNRIPVRRMNAFVTDPDRIAEKGVPFKKEEDRLQYPLDRTVREDIPGFDLLSSEAPNPEQLAFLNQLLRDFEICLWSPRFAHPELGYRKFIDVASFIDMHIMTEVFKNADGFRRSTYFWTHPDTGKIHALPLWDFNYSLGNAKLPGLDLSGPTGWVHTAVNRWQYYWYGRLMLDPEFRLAYWDRFWSLNRGVLSPSAVLARVDQLAAELTEAQERNFQRWPNLLGVHTEPNHDGAAMRPRWLDEVEFLKGWYRSRMQWVEAQSTDSGGVVGVRPPAFDVSGGNVSSGTMLTISDANNSGGTIFFTEDGSDPRQFGGGLAPTAKAFVDPINIDSSREVRARVRVGSARWSPITNASFVVDAAPATAENLVIAEVSYHPASVTEAEVAAGFTDADDFEYVELLNISDRPIDLTEVAFTDGIEFEFDEGVAPALRELEPGERVLVVRDARAFELRYPDSAALVAGEFSGGLRNSGERVELLAADRSTIKAFSYDDGDGWPTDADGGGSALVLLGPGSNPDHTSPINWTVGAPGGSPGFDGFVNFEGDADTDRDGDGSFALEEFFFGTLDGDPASKAAVSLSIDADGHGVLEFQRNFAAGNLELKVQQSDDLVAWADATAEWRLFSTSEATKSDAARMIRVVRLRTEMPLDILASEFYRLNIRSP